MQFSYRVVASLMTIVQIAFVPSVLAQEHGAKQSALTPELVERVHQDVVSSPKKLEQFLGAHFAEAEKEGWEFLLPTGDGGRRAVKAQDLLSAGAELAAKTVGVPGLGLAAVKTSLAHFYVVTPVSQDVGARVGIEIKFVQADAQKLKYAVGIYDSGFQKRHGSRMIETDFSKDARQSAVEQQQLLKVLSGEILAKRQVIAGSAVAPGGKSGLVRVATFDFLKFLIPNAHAGQGTGSEGGFESLLGFVGFLSVVVGGISLLVTMAESNKNRVSTNVFRFLGSSVLLLAVPGICLAVYLTYSHRQ